MKPSGIRKLFAEQGAEGAIYYLSEIIEKLIAEYEAAEAAKKKAAPVKSAHEGE